MTARAPVGDRVRARAKLTTSLRVTGVRTDGYHLIDAEMVTLALADELTFAAAASGTSAAGTLTVTGPYRDGVPTDDRNLILKALRALGRQAAVRIDKQIPAGGGLGGGSADAAATLAWLGCDDLTVAAAVGADVPFCLSRCSRARVRGIGELVDPLPHVDAEVTLIIPPLAMDTAAVYRAWDQLGGPRSDGPNDLEPAAIAVEPRMAAWKQRISDAAGMPVHLAGSGSTWFVYGDRADLATLLAPATVIVTRTDRP
jgi:4-diphosphocytidyl-2-C-methyl-D-erythritol kinase